MNEERGLRPITNTSGAIFNDHMMTSDEVGVTNIHHHSIHHPHHNGREVVDNDDGVCLGWN